MEWVVVFKTNKMFEAEIFKSKLEHREVQVVIVNKQDSSYLNFGYIELHVPQEQRDLALSIIQEQE